MKKDKDLEKYEVDREDEYLDEVGVPKWGIFLTLTLIGACLIFAVLSWSKDCPQCPEIPPCELECPEFNVSCPACVCPAVDQECICPEFPNISFPNLSNLSCPACICDCGDIIFTIPTPSPSPTSTATPTTSPSPTPTITATGTPVGLPQGSNN